uniref:Protein kinase domain-containing protein n=1 Tax=Physcomitrium patens TaxID=3218 RepID=A0A2K1KA57_PHYPA|nr:hypothetical protein PHYPA_009837 [Physcomitrium patens]
MDAFDNRRNFTPDVHHFQEPANAHWGGGDAHRVLVVIDATKALSCTVTDWALDHVLQRGDILKLLGVLQQTSTPSKAGFQAGLSKLGYKSSGDEKGLNRYFLESEVQSRKNALLRNLDLHLRCQKLGVTLDIDVQVSRDLKTLVVDVAKNFGAHHVVLERSMKKDKKYFIDNLTCYVTRVKTFDTYQPLRPGLHPDMIMRPISPAFGSQSTAIANHRRLQQRPMTADSDLHSIQDEAEVIESEAESKRESMAYIDPILRQDIIAVRQWLEDQGSPGLGMYSREESLRRSASPSSDIVSLTEDSCLEYRKDLSNRLETTGSVRQGSAETFSDSCISPASDGSPNVSSSVTQPSKPQLPSVRHLPCANELASNSPTVISTSAYPRISTLGRSDTSSPADNDPRNGNGAQWGPISVQPRRVDASWTLHNLNELLNGDLGSYLTPPTKVSTKQMEVNAVPVSRPVPPKKSTQALSSTRLNFVQLQAPNQLNPVQSLVPRGIVPVPVQRFTDRVASDRRPVITKKPGPLAPFLCTICKHKTPEFGKPVRRFSYAELCNATDYFNHRNYLAQGGYGSVYRGTLPEGQLIAVKQHKIASSQGDDEFCAEVEVLSCAQHRNLVTLIGYCVENHKRLLVYEYVCNGSLDRHLSAKNRESLPWKYRQKIALGSARALRYLHAECRVGCIVHRDMRPNNILLTHDFTPMVGDFGLARRQMHGDLAEETRVLGTLGYLAPEYAETGQITEKADVYAFGVVLLEILTGRKAVIQQGAKGGVFLTDWIFLLNETRYTANCRQDHCWIDPTSN